MLFRVFLLCSCMSGESVSEVDVAMKRERKRKEGKRTDNYDKYMKTRQMDEKKRIEGV